LATIFSILFSCLFYETNGRKHAIDACRHGYDGERRFFWFTGGLGQHATRAEISSIIVFVGYSFSFSGLPRPSYAICAPLYSRSSWRMKLDRFHLVRRQTILDYPTSALDISV
jgi:hypothetical protein